jgi:hypothetical protein
MQNAERSHGDHNEIEAMPQSLNKSGTLLLQLMISGIATNDQTLLLQLMISDIATKCDHSLTYSATYFNPTKFQHVLTTSILVLYPPACAAGAIACVRLEN